MWIERKRYEAMLVELAEWKMKCSMLESKAKEETPPPPVPTIEPNVDEERAARIAKILSDGRGGTKWRRYQKKTEQALRNPPKEQVVETPATAGRI